MNTTFINRIKKSAYCGSLALALCISFVAASSPAVAQSTESDDSKDKAVDVYNEGVVFDNQNNFERASKCYKEALQLDPSLSSAHLALGNVLLNSGKFEEALPECEIASQVSPSKADVWFAIGQCATRLQKYEEALAAFKHYLSLERTGANAEFATECVEILQHQFFAQLGTTDYTGSYLNDSKERETMTWNVGAGPIKVYIADGKKVAEYLPAYDKILRESFNDWTVVSDGKIQFEFVDDRSKAQICCKWSNNKSDLGGGAELGLTKVKFNQNGLIMHADIIFLTALSEDNVIEAELCRRSKAVDLHEIGHALGLQHSSKSYDIMYSTVLPWGLEHALTYRDHNSVTALYSRGSDGFNTAFRVSNRTYSNSAVFPWRR